MRQTIALWAVPLAFWALVATAVIPLVRDGAARFSDTLWSEVAR